MKLPVKSSSVYVSNAISEFPAMSNLICYILLIFTVFASQRLNSVATIVVYYKSLVTLYEAKGRR